jgi:hypothetical protein
MALANLKAFVPDLPPSGRRIRQRVLVGGDPGASKVVEVQLGQRPDRRDFLPTRCLAKRKGTGDQCGRLPVKGRAVCCVHGAGSLLRQRNGEKLPPEVSGALRGVRHTGRPQIETRLLEKAHPWLADRMDHYRAHPDALSLQEDVVVVTALRDLLLSGLLDLDVVDLVRLVSMLTQVRANAIKTKHAIEVCDMVPGPRVRELMGKLVEIIRQFTPEDRLPEVARALRVLAPNAVPTGDSVE